MGTTARIILLTLSVALASSGSAMALTNEEANKIKESVLHHQMPVLTVACGLRDDGKGGYTQSLNHDLTIELSCALALRIIVEDFIGRGYFGRSICPPAGTEYKASFDKIIDYIVLEKPIWTERAVDVALNALMRAYPCNGKKSAVHP
jgi:hypothetical protein